MPHLLNPKERGREEREEEQREERDRGRTSFPIHPSPTAPTHPPPPTPPTNTYPPHAPGLLPHPNVSTTLRRWDAGAGGRPNRQPTDHRACGGFAGKTAAVGGGAASPNAAGCPSKRSRYPFGQPSQAEGAQTRGPWRRPGDGQYCASRTSVPAGCGEQTARSASARRAASRPPERYAEPSQPPRSQR